jgi:hypothetical protein
MQELQTLVTEIEATLNDRPITYVGDGEPLTPSHLIHGRLLRILPHKYVTDEELNDPDFELNVNQKTLDKRAVYIGKLFEHFWQRWRSEYLLALRERHLANARHGTVTENCVKEGDIVLVHDDVKKRVDWSLARIVRLNYGNDKLVRSAEIRTKHGTTNRPIAKLYPLEVRAVEAVDTGPKVVCNKPEDIPVRPKRQAALNALDKFKNWVPLLS